jgi:hypothetical protein
MGDSVFAQLKGLPADRERIIFSANSLFNPFISFIIHIPILSSSAHLIFRMITR